MNAVELRGISKSYGKVAAVSDVSLTVNDSEIYGLIGPDGAGKTTLFRIMTTLMLPDKGEGRICGHDMLEDMFKIRKIIGYMPGHFSLYQDLTVKENLEFFATIFGTTVRENYDTVKEIYSQIEPFGDRRAGKLSGGMKQKLALCCALIHKPEILFLDEPTTGVDAVSRKDFWNMLGRIRKTGVTIIVSTPYMDEASMCDRISLVKDGHIVKTGTPEQIRSSYPYDLLAVKGTPMPSLLKFLRKQEGVISCFSFGDCHHLAYDRKKLSPEDVRSSSLSAGFSDVEVLPAEPGIEDCFMQIGK